jgi:hypothetical protein
VVLGSEAADTSLFIQTTVCKFAGKAYVGDKLAAQADFTAMIADPPAA